MAEASLPGWLSIAESIVKIAGYAAGGAWALFAFLRRRERFPRASVKQRCTRLPLDAERVIVRIELTVTNVGETLLRIRSLTSWLQQISPLPSVGNGAFIPKPSSANPEIEWPIYMDYFHFFGVGEREVEPAESETFQFDYIVPSSVEIVQAYSYITNPLKWFTRLRRMNRPKEIGWSCTDIFALQQSDPGEANI